VTSERESASCDPSLAVTEDNVRLEPRDVVLTCRSACMCYTTMRLGNTREDLSLLCTGVESVLQVRGLIQGLRSCWEIGGDGDHVAYRQCSGMFLLHVYFVFRR